MKEIADEMDFQPQPCLDKKQWRKVVDKNARALEYIISNKLYNDVVSDD
jgi:hypothetical protein